MTELPPQRPALSCPRAGALHCCLPPRPQHLLRPMPPLPHPSCCAGPGPRGSFPVKLVSLGSSFPSCLQMFVTVRSVSVAPAALSQSFAQSREGRPEEGQTSRVTCWVSSCSTGFFLTLFPEAKRPLNRHDLSQPLLDAPIWQHSLPGERVCVFLSPSFIPDQVSISAEVSSCRKTVTLRGHQSPSAALRFSEMHVPAPGAKGRPDVPVSHSRGLTFGSHFCLLCLT